MTRAQFARVHAYSSLKASGVLDEAERIPGCCGHVESPRPADWLVGSRADVQAAIEKHIQTTANLRLRSGRTVQRKRKATHRCLVAGTVSHPSSMQLVWTDQAEKRLVAKWISDTKNWLLSMFDDRLTGICLHTDESHPHLHFFVVGDAQRLHPGMRAEVDESTGTRHTDNQERMRRHKAGLRAWLDNYQSVVGSMNNLVRSTGARETWRIKDRGTRAEIVKLHSQIDQVLDLQQRERLQASVDALYNEAEKVARPRMRF